MKLCNSIGQNAIKKQNRIKENCIKTWPSLFPLSKISNITVILTWEPRFDTYSWPYMFNRDH